MDLQTQIRTIFKKIKESSITPFAILILLPLVFFYKLLLHPLNVLYPAADILNAYSLWKNFYVSNVLAHHVIPLWNPYEFSGVPFIANVQAGIAYPLNLIYFIFPVDLAFGYAFILDLMFLGLFTYLYARVIGIGKTGALAAGIIITFSGTIFSRVYAGHIFILDTFIWLPLILYFLEKTLQKKTIIYGFYMSIPIVCMFLAGSSQIALYGILFLLIYVLLRILFDDRRKLSLIKAVGCLGIGLIIAIFLSSVQLLPILEFSKISSRGGGVNYIFASSFSLPPKQILSFIFPFFFGSPIDNTFWGRGSFWELCGYVGTLPLIFAGLSFFSIKNKFVKIFTLLALFSILFSLGSYAFTFPLFYRFIPLFNLFRAPARFLFFYAFSMSILAGIGIDLLINHKNQLLKLWFEKIRLVFLVLSLVVFGAALLLKIGNFINFFEKLVLKNSYAVGVDRKILYEYAVNSFLIFSIFLLLGAIFVYISKNKSTKKIFGFLIILAVFFELFIFDSKFVDTKSVSDYYKIPSEIQYVEKDKSTFRIYDWDTGSFNLAERQGLENVVGYDPIYLSYYRDFLSNLGTRESADADNYIQISVLKNYNILRFLNVKYVLSKNEIENSNLKFVYKKDFYVYQLLDTLPRAYLVDLNNSQDKNFALPTSLIAVSEKKISANELELNVDVKSSKKLVLSEIWYPGWVAYDSNREIAIEKFYIFRSINLKSGMHSIRFEYKPLSFEIGKWVSLISLFTFSGVIIWLYKRKR